MTSAAILPRTAIAAFSTDCARDFACNVLRAAGVASVLPANDSAHAVLCAKDQRPDVIVTDWPDNGGTLEDMVRALRSIGEAMRRDLPIVLLTAREGRADLEAAREAGIAAYIVKPVSAALLKHRLAKVCGDTGRKL